MINNRKSLLKKLTGVILAAVLVLGFAGTAFADWNYDGYGWWYQNYDGSYPAGSWQQIDGEWYHFDNSGYMQTGWIYDGNWYYLSGSGAMYTGWLLSGDNWYYMLDNGVMAAGIWEIGGQVYYFDDDGRWFEPEDEYQSSGLVPPYELDNYYDFMRTMTDSEYLEAYNAAAYVVESLVGLSREEQLYWIAVYLREIFESGMTYSMSAPHYNDPYGYFILGSASCAGCAKATGMCLNILGIPYEHVNEGQYSHQWCRVYVNGEYWICDAYGLYVGPEPAPYVHPYLS